MNLEQEAEVVELLREMLVVQTKICNKIHKIEQKLKIVGGRLQCDCYNLGKP